MIRNSILLLPLSILLLSSCSQGEKNRLILAHSLDTQHSVHKAMVFLSERLNELSGGRMEIAIYPSQQLGTERQCLELLQIGSIDITKVSAGVMEGFAPVYKVLGIPYIFENREHSFRVLDGPIGEDLLERGSKFLLRGLCFYDSGSRSFYTQDRPINRPEDVAGMKIRVMSSATSIDMVKAFGGAATPISWGELYTALQGGVVDGAENNPPSFYLSHHFEVCKYYSLDEHTSIPDVVVISTTTWNKLTPSEKEWLSQAVKESVVFQRKLWLESELESLEEVKKAGVVVSYPDKQPFMDKLRPLMEQYRKDPEIAGLMDAIEKERDDSR